MLTIDHIQAATTFLKGRIRETPVEHSLELSRKLGVPVWFKLENLQVTGSFKARGALYAMSRMKEDGVHHVATCSAGNHGKGVAWSAMELGMRATIFVPSSVDPVKFQAMQDMGADVRKSNFLGYDETESWAVGEAERLGLPFLSAYDDVDVMAGNGGTVAVEVNRQVPDASTFVLPVGGGGHAAGFATFMKHEKPSCRIVLCQHEDSPGFLRSIEAGKPVTELPAIKTLASGLEGGFGVKTFEVLRHRYDDIRLVSESELRDAMRWMIDHHQILIEGSSAVPIAACLNDDFLEKDRPEGANRPDGPVVIFISGRNVARETILDVLSEK